MSRTNLLPFEVEVGGRSEEITGRAGLTLVGDLLRKLGLAKLVLQNMDLVGASRKIEQILLTMAAGGDSIDDCEVLRADAGFARLLGRHLQASSTIRSFLYEFHDEHLIEEARAALPPDAVAYIPKENAALTGLDQVRTEMNRRFRGTFPLRRATIDYDATIQESHKREAKYHYKGGRGYQPAVAYWVEADLVVADEYRDGNVAAGMNNLPVVRRAFANLPPGIEELAFRSDSAAYEEKVLAWLLDPNREGCPGKTIAFTISADMTDPLRKACVALPPSAWVLHEDRADERVDCAEVEFYPTGVPVEQEPRRYIAIRFEKKQGRLFANGGAVKHLAVVTNRWELSPTEIIRWHWEKAGTIEKVHDVVKNELGGGVPPCGRFGANAAWFRLSLLTYNVLSMLRRTSLPETLAKARPKRLRYVLFAIPGRIAGHARRLVLTIAEGIDQVSGFAAARRRLAELTFPTLVEG
jgi:hypothetical protein